MAKEGSAEATIRNIKRKTRRKYSAEETERNAEIRQRHAEGGLVRDLAHDFGISEQRVSEIIRGKRR